MKYKKSLVVCIKSFQDFRQGVTYLSEKLTIFCTTYQYDTYCVWLTPKVLSACGSFESLEQLKEYFVDLKTARKLKLEKLWDLTLE